MGSINLQYQRLLQEKRLDIYNNEVQRKKAEIRTLKGHLQRLYDTHAEDSVHGEESRKLALKQAKILLNQFL
jgi:hypothetical protein